MENFDLIRNHLAMCGIPISKKTLQNHSFNVKNSTVIILVYIFVILSMSSLNEAHTFGESIDIFLHSLSQSFAGMIYVMIVRKTSEIIEFINGLEDIINQRE